LPPVPTGLPPFAPAGFPPGYGAAPLPSLRGTGDRRGVGFVLDGPSLDVAVPEVEHHPADAQERDHEETDERKGLATLAHDR